ncbi:hypothetical protein DMT42_26600 [Streptomyces actuosus]|uniref:Uncharacterized protein n=1 Tax=Streptomyces actuosus TaxID=1885 RepID=A0A2U9P8Q9_STRAS|nr:hypothetical protein DMT42_26600 [Streptomyces actuosus]
MTLGCPCLDGRAPGAAAGRGWEAQPGACGVPLRPPVPPQRHDCPQLPERGGRATGGPQSPAAGRGRVGG